MSAVYGRPLLRRTKPCYFGHLSGIVCSSQIFCVMHREERRILPLQDFHSKTNQQECMRQLFNLASNATVSQRGSGVSTPAVEDWVLGCAPVAVWMIEYQERNLNL